ncbi:MAG: tetratricopeptide repeat protein [Bryobacteraceae bacterium]
MPRVLVLLAISVCAAAQNRDPAYASLDRAYRLLRAKDYGHAIAEFQAAIKIAPDRASIRKDLAYTLLKIGGNERARDEFAAAMRLDPEDDSAALEYAFLCDETQQRIEARRVFDRIRKKGNTTAAQAFENIDRPLREGIARWSRAAELEPDNFSARQELARLAEQRDDLALAAANYEKAWRLRPEKRSLLVDLGRVWKERGREQDAMSALLAASRGAEPYVADEARDLLPKRYPYVYEFEKAIELDPSNLELRRELAYLYLQMKNASAAEAEFRAVAKQAPGDLLSDAQLGFLLLNRGDRDDAMPYFEKVLAGDDDELAAKVRVALHMPPVLSARPESAAQPGQAAELGAKSLEKGYLKDALKFLDIAHENDPLDFNVMLKLGWTYNLLKDDQDAVRWFDLARRSPDPKIAAEAGHAYRNLKPEFERFRTTVWFFPMFSTRWHDGFAYSQAKTELNLRGWFVRPYASLRFIGDTTGSVDVANLGPQYLSERSAIVALGLATAAWHGATGWFEAGEAMQYSARRIAPDYRGGVSYGKGFGGLLAPGARGFFAETNDDGIFVSRFGNDTLLYSQNRAGLTLRSPEGFGGLHAQIYWNGDATVDALGEYWANTVETGPGLRLRFEGMPAAMRFSIDALRGAYLINTGNPRRPNYNDVRVGIWYAFSK